MSDSKNLSFSVQMNDLRRIVFCARSGLGTSKTDLVVLLFRVTITKDTMSVFAFDKEVFVRSSSPIDNHSGEEGSFALLGSRLVKLISQVDSEIVKFTVDSENVETVAGFLTVNFELYDDVGLKSYEDTLLTEVQAVSDWNDLPRNAVEEGLTCARTCTTSNSIRPDLTHVEIRNGRLFSSDGRKILIMTHDSFPKELTFKVPSVVLSSVIGALKAMIDDESVRIQVGKSYYYLVNPDLTMVVGIRKVERNFPAVEVMVTNVENPTDEVAVDKLVLETMIRGVSLGLQTDDVKVTLDLVGSGPDAYLEISSLNSLGRRSHERASCGRKAPSPLSFPVSFKHLLDTLAVFKGDSVVDILVLTNRHLMMVRDTTVDREVLTVVPFRTQTAIDQEKKDSDARKSARELEKKASDDSPDPKPSTKPSTKSGDDVGSKNTNSILDREGRKQQEMDEYNSSDVQGAVLSDEDNEELM